MAGDEAAEPGPLASKIDRLFKMVHPAKGEYTHEQVATAIREAGGPTISATYLWQLRKGYRDNPTMRHLEALAGFFGVSPLYFFDDEAAAHIDAELALLGSIRDTGVRALTLRIADLSPDSLAAITSMVDQVRALEGLERDEES